MDLPSCESSIGFTEQAFESDNNVQILSMEKYILQSLDQLKAVKDETKLFLHCSASCKKTSAFFTFGRRCSVGIAYYDKNKDYYTGVMSSNHFSLEW